MPLALEFYRYNKIESSAQVVLVNGTIWRTAKIKDDIHRAPDGKLRLFESATDADWNRTQSSRDDVTLGKMDWYTPEIEALIREHVWRTVSPFDPGRYSYVIVPIKES